MKFSKTIMDGFFIDIYIFLFLIVFLTNYFETHLFQTGLLLIAALFLADWTTL